MEETNCDDCTKNANQKALIGIATGVVVGAGITFVVLKYVLK